VTQRTWRAIRSTSFSARLLHSSRQICGGLTTLITVQLTTKSGASASLDKSAQDVDDLRQRLIDVWTGIQQSVIYNAIEWQVTFSSLRDPKDEQNLEITRSAAYHVDHLQGLILFY